MTKQTQQTQDPIPADHGDDTPQPLDRILAALQLKNHDLVAASRVQLTHKMISKARKGQRVSTRVQLKILDALNACQTQTVFTRTDLFAYTSKQHREETADEHSDAPDC